MKKTAYAVKVYVLKFSFNLVAKQKKKRSIGYISPYPNGDV